jgi:plastocyanin
MTCMRSAFSRWLGLGLTVCATLVTAPLASGASGAGLQQQACPLPVVGADPDTVTLAGPSTLWPPDKRFVSYTLTAAETAGEKGDGLPHGVTISYSIATQDKGVGATAGASPASGNTQGDFSVPIRFRLQADRAGAGHGRTYTINWSASFDGGPHTCSSSDTGRSPFVVVVPHDQSSAFHAQGILDRAGSAHHTLTVNDTDGDATLRGHEETLYVGPATKIRRDGTTATFSSLTRGDKVAVVGSRDRRGHMLATTVDATSPPTPDGPAAAVPGNCPSSSTPCTPALPPSTGGPAMTITISDFVYNVPAAVVPAGTVVTVRNLDGFAHTFTGNHLDSGYIAGGSSYTVAFTKPGTYRFFCSIHPFMNGVLDVR